MLQVVLFALCRHVGTTGLNRKLTCVRFGRTSDSRMAHVKPVLSELSDWLLTKENKLSSQLYYGVIIADAKGEGKGKKMNW